MKSEFGKLGDDRSHMAVVVIDGLPLFTFEAPKIEVESNVAVEREEIAPGIFKQKGLWEGTRAKIVIEGWFNPGPEITIEGN